MRYLMMLLFFPLLFACSVNNTKIDDSLSKYFEQNKLDGTFALFDNGTGEFTVYNMARYRDSAYLPAETFDIVNALIGIETGIVKDSSAISDTLTWFRQLAQQIGKDTMQRWIDTLGYARLHGKFQIANNLDTFWLDNSAKVSADEQLGLVKKLYFGQLPFQPRSQRIVKNVMLRENNSNYKLSYITGSGISDQGYPIGWVVGWIEENRHPYFFVLQCESRKRLGWQIDPVRVDLLKEILVQYGFMEGKR